MPHSSTSRTPRSHKTAGRIVGGLFLSALLLYGGGASLIFSATGDEAALPENTASLWQLCAGSILQLLNSAAVITIGVVTFRVLRPSHRRSAYVYAAARTAEGALLALAPAGTLLLAVFVYGQSDASGATGFSPTRWARTLVENGDTAYLVAMTTLGVGSIFFCGALWQSALLPRLLAVGGVVGYATFALGSVLELSGYGVGLVMSLPGALFEVAAGLYLLIHGFHAPTPASASFRHATSAAATTRISPAAGEPSDAR